MIKFKFTKLSNTSETFPKLEKNQRFFLFAKLRRVHRNFAILYEILLNIWHFYILKPLNEPRHKILFDIWKAEVLRILKPPYFFIKPKNDWDIAITKNFSNLVLSHSAFWAKKNWTKNQSQKQFWWNFLQKKSPSSFYHVIEKSLTKDDKLGYF